MRPGSATSLPDSTTCTGLPCLLVGAREHRGRSDIEVDHVATTVHILPVMDPNRLEDSGEMYSPDDQGEYTSLDETP